MLVQDRPLGLDLAERAEPYPAFCRAPLSALLVLVQPGGQECGQADLLCLFHAATLPRMDMSGLEWTPDVSIYRQPWRENTGACLQAPAGEGITMTEVGLEALDLLT